MNVDIIVLRVADLGFPHGATTAEIIDSASKLGLELCPPQLGPEYRLKYKEQPLGEKLHIAMKPITSADGEPRIFVLARNSEGLSLDGALARPDTEWNHWDKFMFCIRQWGQSNTERLGLRDGSGQGEQNAAPDRGRITVSRDTKLLQRPGLPAGEHEYSRWVVDGGVRGRRPREP
ncbi:MAG: hypothetical protein NUW37_06590 [Planctomycetes bacterium]|nr:hypothetical protein [Planctomycetota bacterium]